MIAADAERSADVAARIERAADYGRLPGAVADLCQALLATAVEVGFPGALIPSVQSDNEVWVYVATPTSADWRRLRPVLVAFAGPTLTSFGGLPIDLPSGDPVADLVRETLPVATTLVRMPNDHRSLLAGLRALERMRTTLARAPILQRRAPEPTSWLLARFQDHLNVGARDQAAAVLQRLRAELRLDALNLRFLEVQLLAAFAEWSAIPALPTFANLCRARKPPAIAALLLEALYRTHLEIPFEASDENAARAAYEEEVRPFAQPMISLPAPASLTEGAWRVIALEAWVAPGRRDLADAALSVADRIGWLAGRIAHEAAPIASLAPPAEPPLSPIDAARDALAEFDAAPSLDSVADAVATLEKLDAGDLERLLQAEPFRSLLRALQEERPAGQVPRSWLEWLEQAADPTFANALDIARRGMDEWTVGEALNDPVAVQRFVAALERAQGEDLAAERTAQALPFMVAWLRRDPIFPRAAAVPIYSTLLTLLALGAPRGQGTYESSQILIHAMLASGLDEKNYEMLISDIEELAGEGLGVEMVYWLLEVIENLLRFATPAAGVRERFFHTALAKMGPVYGRLSSLQRSAVSRLSRDLGWEIESLGLTGSTASVDTYAERLAGKRIAIYTLTKSSGRQAKAALEEFAPTAVIECNADHVGTATLRALSENADIFVLAWQSAKHAATDFIRCYRAGRPLVYAQGRGFSSILRAVEVYLRDGMP